MFTLAHLSDPHIGPLPDPRLAELASKRLFGYLNWQRGRARAYRPEVLVQLVAAIHAARPDHVAVTGDLVNIGLPAELATARAWLEGLGKPDHVSLVPGNHDAYVRGALQTADRLWRPFMAGDDGTAGFPFIRRRGPVALIGLSTARPTPPLMATGALGKIQIAALRGALSQTAKEGLFRVVLIHHPVTDDGTKWHRRLTDARALRRAIAECGAELILHGHNHQRSLVGISGPSGEVPVVGVPSASSMPGGVRHPGAAFNLYRIDGAPGRFACSMAQLGFTEADKPIRLIAERQLLG